jgi:hypothetical protein
MESNYYRAPWSPTTTELHGVIHGEDAATLGQYKNRFRTAHFATKNIMTNTPF